MAIQNRRGNFADFDPFKMLPGEFGYILDTEELYYCVAPGNIRRVATKEDIVQILDTNQEAYDGLQQLISELEDETVLTGILADISQLLDDVAINKIHTADNRTDIDTNAQDIINLETKTMSHLADKASCAEVNAMLGNLADATPNFANDASGMSDTTKLYVNLSDGFLYAHNGTSWNSTGVKYQGTGIRDESVTLESINNATLLLEYVKGQSQSDLPVKKSGSYEIELNERGNLYLSNGNVIDLLNFSDGTQTLNGVTVTVAGNHVSVVGTATANTYVKLSDGLSVQGSNAGLNSKTYGVPNIPNYSLALANRTYNEDLPGMTVNFRSTVSGNFSSKIVRAVSSHALVPYSNEWASLYMFLPVGNYQVEFDIALMPFEYKVEHEVVPNTKILDNVKKSRVELASGYILSDKSGTATNLVNVYENLQSGTSASDSKGIYVESHTNYFYYYIKGSNEDSNKYLRFTFEKYANVHSKADGWVLSLADAVELGVEEFTYLYPVVVAGEWEMAVRIADSPDFIGCKQHGSEINFYEKFYVDGTEWIPDNSSFWCNEIKVVQKSDMYDPLDDPTPLDQAVPVGEHMRVHTISKESIHLDQRIKWLGDFTMDMSYVTMLPIARGNNAETSHQITAKAYNNDTYEEIDVSVSGHSGNVRLTEPSMWHLYSNSTGISAEVHSIIKNKPASSKTFVQNTADRYNKVYFAYCDAGYEVKNGDVWQNESIYKLNITS